NIFNAFIPNYSLRRFGCAWAIWLLCTLVAKEGVNACFKPIPLLAEGRDTNEMPQSLLLMERTGWSDRRRGSVYAELTTPSARKRWLRGIGLTAHPPLLCEAELSKLICGICLPRRRAEDFGVRGAARCRFGIDRLARY